jgi:hypothetical protein
MEPRRESPAEPRSRPAMDGGLCDKAPSPPLSRGTARAGERPHSSGLSRARSPREAQAPLFEHRNVRVRAGPACAAAVPEGPAPTAAVPRQHPRRRGSGLPSQRPAPCWVRPKVGTKPLQVREQRVGLAFHKLRAPLGIRSAKALSTVSRRARDNTRIHKESWEDLRLQPTGAATRDAATRCAMDAHRSRGAERAHRSGSVGRSGRFQSLAAPHHRAARFSRNAPMPS